MWCCSPKLPIWRDLVVSHNRKENNTTMQIRIHYHTKCTLFSNCVNQPLIPSRLISCSSILVTKMKNNKFLSYKLKTLKLIQTLVNVWLCDQQIKHQPKVKEENEWIKMKNENEKKRSQTMEIMNNHEWKNEQERVYLHWQWSLPSKRHFKRWSMMMESKL